MKLTAIRKLEGTIVLKSGLHIGTGDQSMHIGGIDSAVIKHPHTFEPYIPGSSLKGKVRSLMEMASGLVNKCEASGGLVTVKTAETARGDKKLRDEAESILTIFGCSGADQNEGSPYGPTRVSFADCSLDEGWKKQAQKNNWELTEEKSENSIDRIKGVARNPRQIERVPAGTEFSFCLTFKILNTGDENHFDKLVKGLKLLELDALGGSGSRGYGRIKFINLKLDEKDFMPVFASVKPL